MDSWTFNKLASAVLASLLVIVGANTAVEIFYPTGGPGEVAVVEVEGEDETQTADMTGTDTASDQQAEAEQSLPVLLAAADPQAGQKIWRQCSACHVNEEGGPNRVGPTLYGVVGREVASVDGFGYSNALEEYGGEWTYERLDCFLENPSGCVQGTSMGYAGIKDPADRADMIAYLASIGDAPPFPEPEAEQQEAAAQPDAEAEPAEDVQETVAEPAAEEAEQAAAEPEQVEQDTAEASVAEMEQSAEQREAPAQTGDETAAADDGDTAEADEQASGDDKSGDGESELAALLASADAAEGQSAARACSACHTFDEGGPNRVGPNLYGVVGRQVASVDGFRYSDALKGYGGEWSYDRLDCYLKNPRECVPGNKMTYAGVKDDAKRADIIAYLASLGDAPPLPDGEQDTGQADEPVGETRSARMQPAE